MENQSQAKEKVLLCNFIADYPDNDRFYSYGLYSLKGYCDSIPELRERYDIEVQDIRPGTDNYVEIISSSNPAVVGFSCYMWNVEQVLGCITSDWVTNSNVTIVLGGVASDFVKHAGNMLSAPLPDLLLSVQQPYGEIDLKNILLARLDHTPFTNIPGLCVLQNGAVIKGPPRTSFEDIDNLPSPYLIENIPAGPSLCEYFQLQTARGCIGKCAYCIGGSTENKLQYFDLDRTKRELEWAAKHGVKNVIITDAAINYSTRRLKDLVRIITEAKGPKPMFAYCLHPAFISEEQVDALRPMMPMTERISAGVQSLSEEAGKAMDRNYGNESVINGVALICELTTPDIDLILGLPGETLESFKTAIRTLIQFPIRLNVHTLHIVPGTTFARTKELHKIRHSEFRDGNKVLECATFKAGDFERAMHFLQELRESGDLDSGNIVSLSLDRNNVYSLPKQSSPNRTNEKPNPYLISSCEVAQSQAPGNGSPPIKLTGEASSIPTLVLEPILRIISKGFTHAGWTVETMILDGSAVHTDFINGKARICLSLFHNVKDQPYFKRTTNFQVVYRYPSNLTQDQQKWLLSYISILARCEKQDRREK